MKFLKQGTKKKQENKPSFLPPRKKTNTTVQTRLTNAIKSFTKKKKKKKKMVLLFCQD